MTAERKKRSWAARLRRVVLVLVAAVAFLAVAMQLWIVPAVVRWQLGEKLPEYWSGEATIGTIEFSWFGPTRLRGISLVDDRGRRWARIETVELTLRDFPGLHPVLSEVAVDGVDLRAHFDRGACRLPLLDFPDEPSPLREYVDIRSVVVRNVSVGLVGDGGPELVWRGFHCRAGREGGEYAGRLFRTPAAPATAPAGRQDSLELTFRTDAETLASHVKLSLRHKLKPAEGTLLAAVLDRPELRDVEGVLTADVTTTGKLDELPKANHRGMILLDRWNVAGPHGPLARGAGIEIRLDGRRIQGRDLRGNVCGGKLGGGFVALAGANLRYSGEVTVDGLDLADLRRSLSGRKDVRSGVLAARCGFIGHGTNLADLRTAGVAKVNDADLARSGFLDALLNAVDVEMGAPAGGTDAEAVFHSAGAEVTIDSGRLANKISAIVAEPGGTVNLDTTELDLYLVVAPVTVLRDLFTAVPIPLLGQVLKGATTAAEKLTRVHVLGPWTDPPAKLVRKEPAADVQAGTLAIFKGIVDGGGQLGKGLADSVNSLLNGLLEGDRKKAPPPP